MAEYATDFSPYAADVQPSDWTARWVTADNTWAVRTKAGVQGGKVLENTGTVDGLHFLSWDVIDTDVDRATVEILARVRSSSSTADQFHLRVRGSGTAGAENGYSLIFSSSGNLLRLNRRLAGVNGSIGSTLGIVPQANALYYLKFRANGSDLMGKAWLDGAEEPVDWQVTATDTNIVDPGWVGVGNFESTGTRDFDWVKVVTGGGSATIDTDPTVQINVYQAKMLVMQSETPEFRLYQGKMLVMQSENPQAHVYQLKMLVAIPFGYVAGGSQQPRMVLGF